MKKILLLILVMLFALVGCTQDTGKKDDDDDDDDIIEEVDIDYAEVNDINALLLLLSMEEITISHQDEVSQIRARVDALNEDSKNALEGLEVLENAETIIAALIEDQTKTNEVLEQVKAELNALLPDIVENDLTLPTEVNTEIGKVEVMWGSQNLQTISNTGKVTPGRRIISVELIARLFYKDIQTSISKVVRVKPITFSPLPKSRLAFAYYYGSSSFRGFPQEALDTLDVVNFAFATVVNGEVNVLPLVGREYVLEARKSGVRVILCIGGYANAAIPFSKAAYTEDGRKKLAKSIVDAIEKYHFDGVDIDWEYPGYYNDPSWYITTEQDSANYTAFMLELKTQLKASNQDYLLTAAVPAGDSASRFDIGALNNILDYFHLMTYDMDAADTSTHLTALYSSANTISNWTVDGTVKLYKSRGASPEKLVVGTAFYGREFHLATTGSIMRAKATSRNSIPYKNIESSYLAHLGTDVTRYWDDQAKAPYLYKASTNSVVVYDDPESIMYKSQYASDQGLAGMMFWEYTQDNGTLLRAIYDNLVKGR